MTHFVRKLSQCYADSAPDNKLSGLRTKEIEMRKALSDEMVKRLQEEVNNDDTECAHRNADYILCELLEKLGYKDVVEKYNKVSKWYA